MLSVSATHRSCPAARPRTYLGESYILFNLRYLFTNVVLARLRIADKVERPYILVSHLTLQDVQALAPPGLMLAGATRQPSDLHLVPY